MHGRKRLKEFIICTMGFPFQYFVASALLISSASVTAYNLTDSEILEFELAAEVKASFPYYLSGYDEDGTPIWIFELGKWDMRKYVEKGGELFKAMDVGADQMFLRFKQSALNSTEKQFYSICDMEGFPIRQAGHPKTVKFILSKFARFEQIARNGLMKQGWYLNTNTLWERIWHLGKPLLGALANSIQVYGTNKQVWIPKLLKHLPKDQIPQWYGGSANHKPVKVFP